MGMKRRDFAATLMAVLMAGSIFAGCGSADKNVNHNAEITQNTQYSQDVQLTTQAVADNETKATNDEIETKTQEVDTQVITADSEASGNRNDSDIQETGGQENIAAEDNEWNNGNTEDSNYEEKNTQESVENNNQNSNQNNNGNNAPGESQAPASGGNVNIKDDNSLLASAKVNTVTYSAYASEVLRLVNIERDKVGAAHLVLDGALCDAANMRAIEMDCTGVFEHKRPNGNSCFEVYDICNVEWQSACGENIAVGQATPEDVMKSWLSSAGHKANILSPEYTKMGLGYSVGLSNGQYRGYWAQEFAG